MVANKVGKSRAAVANTLRLLNLSEILKEDLVSGKISMGHARALLGLENPKNMEALRKEIVKKGLSVRQTENKAKKLKNDSAEKSD